MSEFLREVEEDLRGERLLSLWRRWRWVILSFLVAVLVGVGGWEGFIQFRDSRQEQATATYRTALLAADEAFDAWQEEQDKKAEEEAEAKEAEEAEADSETATDTEAVTEDLTEAETETEVEAEEEAPLTDAELRAELDLPDAFYDEEALSELAALAKTDNKSLGTRTLARLQTAFRHYESERYELADTAWLAVIADESAPLLYRDLATVLRGYAMLDLREPSDLRLSLEAVAERSDGAFYASASEALALVLIKEGDFFSARGYLTALADSTSVGDEPNPVPASLRSRANRLLSYLESQEEETQETPPEGEVTESDGETEGESEGTGENKTQDATEGEETEQ